MALTFLIISLVIYIFKYYINAYLSNLPKTYYIEQSTELEGKVISDYDFYSCSTGCPCILSTYSEAESECLSDNNCAGFAENPNGTYTLFSIALIPTETSDYTAVYQKVANSPISTLIAKI